MSVQAGLGITHGAAFDVQAVCSGFVYAVATADGLLRTGAFKRALVVGAVGVDGVGHRQHHRVVADDDAEVRHQPGGEEVEQLLALRQRALAAAADPGAVGGRERRVAHAVPPDVPASRAAA